MNYGKNKTVFMTEREKDKLISDIIQSCIEYAGDSYENFGRNVLQLLKNKELVQYGNKTENRYETVKLPKYSFVDNFGVFDNEEQKWLSYHGVPLSFITKAEAQEVADEENEKNNLLSLEFNNEF